MKDEEAFRAWMGDMPASCTQLDIWLAAIRHERASVITIIHEQAMKDITISNIEVALRERYKDLI